MNHSCPSPPARRLCGISMLDTVWALKVRSAPKIVIITMVDCDLVLLVELTILIVSPSDNSHILAGTHFLYV